MANSKAKQIKLRPTFSPLPQNFLTAFLPFYIPFWNICIFFCSLLILTKFKTLLPSCFVFTPPSIRASVFPFPHLHHIIWNLPSPSLLLPYRLVPTTVSFYFPCFYSYTPGIWRFGAERLRWIRTCPVCLSGSELLHSIVLAIYLKHSWFHLSPVYSWIVFSSVQVHFHYQLLGWKAFRLCQLFSYWG